MVKTLFDSTIISYSKSKYSEKHTAKAKSKKTKRRTKRRTKRTKRKTKYMKTKKRRSFIFT